MYDLGHPDARLAAFSSAAESAAVLQIPHLHHILHMYAGNTAILSSCVQWAYSAESIRQLTCNQG